MPTSVGNALPSDVRKAPNTINDVNSAARTVTPIILASASPRRRAIVGALGVPFEAVDVAVDERPQDGEQPTDLARRLALAKALQGARRFPDWVALGADTVVAL